jgi:Protein of unknown function (DUF2853)
MATASVDYQALVAKYTSKVNMDAVTAIVKYCGPALKSTDSRYVAASDKKETGRIVKGFCAKKLGLGTEAATAAVDAAALRMKADRMKHRVPFYYLIAEHAGKLGLLSGTPEAAPKVAAVVPGKAETAPKIAVVAQPAPRVSSPVVEPLPVAQPLPVAPAVVSLKSAPTPAANPESRWYMLGSRYHTLASRFRNYLPF